jgi:hypothetical protein
LVAGSNALFTVALRPTKASGPDTGTRGISRLARKNSHPSRSV